MKPYYSKKAEVGDIIDVYESLHQKQTIGSYDNNAEFNDWKIRDLKGLEFVVERTAMKGGGTGHGGYDTYPDGWHVEARALDKNGTYDPGKKTIGFYQDGFFLNMIEEVKVIGKMKMGFERIGGRK